MEIYVLMLIVAVSAYSLNLSSNEFRGSFETIKTVLAVGAAIGFLSVFAFTVYAIFKITWWHPIVGLMAVSALSAFISGVLRLLPRIIVDVLSLIGVVIGSYFMWVSL